MGNGSRLAAATFAELNRIVTRGIMGLHKILRNLVPSPGALSAPPGYFYG
jgi:hypothetical protein